MKSLLKIFLILSLVFVFCLPFLPSNVFALVAGEYGCNSAADCQPNCDTCTATCCMTPDGGGSHVCASDGGGPYCASPPYSEGYYEATYYSEGYYEGYYEGTYAPYVDLVGHGVTPISATVGTPLTFTSNVSNMGTMSTGVGFNNLFQVATAAGGGGTVSTISVNTLPALAAGANANVVSSSYTFNSVGTYSVRACADNNASMVGAITESSEGNNCGPWTNVSASSCVVAGSGTGLTAKYFDGMALGSLITTRIDSMVNFDPADSLGVSYANSADGDTFSVRWEGQVQPRCSEAYNFFTRSDDGARLWVNNNLVIDQWVDQGPTEADSGLINLVGGTKYNIKMEYYENGGGATAQLKWSSPFTAKELIPQSQLYPLSAELTAGATTPVTAFVNSPVTFVSNIQNTGALSTGVGFNNLFQVATAAGGGGTVSTISVNTLSALADGANANVVSSSYTFNSVGTYSVRACADNNASMVGTIAESNEGNNCGPWVNVTVSGAISCVSSSNATGGTISVTNVNNIYYQVHKFTSGGTFVAPTTGTSSVEYLVVGGGGSGGSSATAGGRAGGGGAGGLLTGSGYVVTSGQSIAVTVGAGGAGKAANSNKAGANGGNSVFGTVTALGGGGGGAGYSTTPDGLAGGSGGGDGYLGTGSGGLGTVGQGNNGGAQSSMTGVGYAAGGGGAGATGVSGTPSSGGDGLISAITGASVYYAGGGQGGNSTLGGGQGGGGASGVAGVANTGGGGGGGYAATVAGGAGGSGIVVVRYPISCGPVSGTLVPDFSSCTIPDGLSSCNVNLSWSVTNPETTPTSITANGMSNIDVSTSISTPQSGTQSVTVPYGGRTFYLYNNAKSLVPTSPSGSGVAVAAVCSSGVWDGAKCIPNTVSFCSYPSNDGSGGTPTDITVGANNYHVQTFSSGTTNLVIPSSGVSSIDYLVVGGGGGGGGRSSTTTAAGGGGAGGMLVGTTAVTGGQIISVTVGAGGAGGTTATTIAGNGGSGGNSSLGAIAVAKGGGGGIGAITAGSAGVTGGSGGGGRSSNSTPAAGGTASGTPVGQGNAGGSGISTGGGGGGGAGAAGVNGSTNTGGAGGAGLASSIQTGSSIFYAGGGGGRGNNTGGAGGNGGGGGAGTVGTNGLGGGGGGANASNTAGKAGGNGIVVIRYNTSAVGMCGTLTGSSCTINSGANSCTANLNWSVINPESSTVGITANGMSNIIFIVPPLSGVQSVTVPYPGNTFYLYDNSKLVAPALPITATCVSGTSWNSGLNLCVPPPPVVTISSNPATGGTNVVNPAITWSATNSPTSCSFSGDWTNTNGGAVSGTNISQGVLTTSKTYTYTIVCSNVGGAGAPQSATVTVSPPPSISATPSTIFTGGSAAINWSVTGGPLSCTGSGSPEFNFTVNASSGSVTVHPLSTTTYTLNCNGAISTIKVIVKKKPGFIEN